MRRVVVAAIALVLVWASLRMPSRRPWEPEAVRTRITTVGSTATAARRTTLLVRIDRRLPVRRWPGAGRVVGWMPAVSRYYHRHLVTWVLRTARHGRYGEVPVPYVARHRIGWIDLRGLRRSRTAVRVAADLSKHLIVVRRWGNVVVRAPAATGAASTPTPAGRYFVTDRVAFRPGSAYGSFAFGISGIQPRLPSGWTAGDQLAIHGTNDPSSIGRSASAGCLRVSERTLRRLKPLLARGTPVVISS